MDVEGSVSWVLGTSSLGASRGADSRRATQRSGLPGATYGKPRDLKSVPTVQAAWAPLHDESRNAP